MGGGVGGLSGSYLNKQVQEGEGSWGEKSNSRGIVTSLFPGRLLSGGIWFPKTSEMF